MNWLDIVLLIILAASVIGGLRSGLLRSVCSLAGLIIGVTLAGRFYEPLGEQLSSFLQVEIAKVVAFVIILVVILVGASILGTILTKTASALILGWLNHLGGGAFGLAMGGIVCAAILATWVKFLGGNAIEDSMIAQLLLKQFPIILALLPEEFDSVREFFGGNTY